MRTHPPVRANDGDVVLILGSHRQSISVARALAQSGWQVILGQRAGSGTAWIGRSRSVTSIWKHPPLDTSDHAFRDALLRYIDAHDRLRAIFPIGDREIDAIDAIRDELPTSVRLVMPRSLTIRTCRDKCATFSVARSLGVPVAPYRELPALDPDCSFEGIGLPAVLKPVSEQTRIFGGKAFIANRIDDVRRAVARHGAPAGRLIVQEFVHGSRFNVYFFATEGVVNATLTVRVVRTDRLDGTGYAVDSVTAPLPDEWVGHLQRMVAKLQYHGAGCLQFIRDETTGHETFLEINSRLGANYRCAERFGLALPVWWISQSLDEHPHIPNPFSYPPGKHIGWFLGDLHGLVTTLAEGHTKPGTLIGWAVRTMRTLSMRNHITWVWSDPNPTIWAFAGLLRSWPSLRKEQRSVPNQVDRGFSPPKPNPTFLK